MKRIGDPPFGQEAMEQTVKELQEAGITDIHVAESEQEQYVDDGHPGVTALKNGIYAPDLMKDAKTEKVKVYRVTGKKFGWEFFRDWRYWRANATSGKAVKGEVAGMFNRRWGNDVRVEGYDGGKEVTGPVAFYHVDTQEGLNEQSDYVSKYGVL